MADKILNLGVDLGNYDLKTQHTITPSSYEKTLTENLLAEDIIEYNGSFYYSTDSRSNQEKDKTRDEYALIMTLIGIAKEIVYQASIDTSSQPLQDKVSSVKNIKLGVGLPIGYFSELKSKTESYYNDAFKNGVHLRFKGKLSEKQWVDINFTVDTIRIFPQDLTAVVFNRKAEIPKVFDSYYIFGMGGGTVDIIPIKNKAPQVQDCVSLPLGTTEMYKEISKTLQKNGVNDKEYQTIEDVLCGKPTILPNEEIKMINDCVDDFAKKLVDNFKHRELKLRDYPSVFIGGGALLLRKQLENSSEFGKLEIIDDVKENAVYYAYCL